ncbi:MAG: peptidylprolyl isomerase [Thiogranum sp.]
MTMAHLIPLVMFLSALLVSGAASADDGTLSAQQQSQPLVFAKVGEQLVTRKAFDEAFSRAVRSRFYHGKPPEGELDSMRREVADEIITRVLLLQEAGRRGLSADDKPVQAMLDSYDQRYAGNPRWQAQRETLLATLKQKLLEEELLTQLEARVRQLPPPSSEEVLQYYEANPDKFTEPARQQVSVILLQVDPSSSTAVWEAALTEADGLVKEMEQGAAFEELARLHSSDRSAENGGNMGYLHHGMLSPAAQTVIDELELGEVSRPVRLLKGVAVFRVADRKAARLRAFEDVNKRARELLIRELSDQAWTSLKEQLKSSTAISVYSEIMPAVSE